MKKILVGFVFGLAMFGAGVALADKTIVYTTANSKVYAINFTSQDNGTTITAVVCGFTKDGAGAQTPRVCTQPKNLPAGALKTAIAPLFTGAGLTYWKNDQGL